MELARNLQAWSMGDDIKICASSRPYIEFDDISFDSPDQKLHLHQLTRSDIELYTRRQIEKDSRFEQLKTDYFRLVDEVVEMAEGVFLWARLVVCELLSAMHRNDRKSALRKKLMVMPCEINTLYTQMLSSLAADDQERAYKMLLLTVHNPFAAPLPSIFYAWIDDLDDFDFPPTDGARPSDWPLMEELNENVRLQLMSITKGLLETSPTENSSSRLMGPTVSFSHRTVRDFVLNRFDAKPETFHWPLLSQNDTYCRLLLAGLTTIPRQHQVRYWNEQMAFEIANHDFCGGFPVTLFTGLTCLLEAASHFEDEDGSSIACAGCMKGCGSLASFSKLSSIHMAAYAGQLDYLMREISYGRSLSNDSKDLHVLLSAAIGGQKILVKALLDHGASPADKVAYRSWDEEMQTTITQDLPLWLVYTAYIVCLWFKQKITPLVHKGTIDERAEILELLLQDNNVNGNECIFLMGRDRARPATYYLTLRQFVEVSKVQNASRLLGLLDDQSRTSSSLPTMFRDTNLAENVQARDMVLFNKEVYKDGGSWHFDIHSGDLKIESSWEDGMYVRIF